MKNTTTPNKKEQSNGSSVENKKRIQKTVSHLKKAAKHPEKRSHEKAARSTVN